MKYLVLIIFVFLTACSRTKVEQDSLPPQKEKELYKVEQERAQGNMNPTAYRVRKDEIEHEPLVKF